MQWCDIRFQMGVSFMSHTYNLDRTCSRTQPLLCQVMLAIMDQKHTWWEKFPPPKYVNFPMWCTIPSAWVSVSRYVIYLVFFIQFLVFSITPGFRQWTPSHGNNKWSEAYSLWSYVLHYLEHCHKIQLVETFCDNNKSETITSNLGWGSGFSGILLTVSTGRELWKTRLLSKLEMAWPGLKKLRTQDRT